MNPETLPRAHGEPLGHARMRVEPEDFQVDEQLGFAPDGQGEHVLLRIRKRDRTTDQVVRTLARLTGVPQSAIGYAGLKDRHAVTTQWLTVPLAGRSEPDWSQLDDADCRVLERYRHGRKLRRGALSGNRFRLILREFRPAGAESALEQRWQRIIEDGVPNYFGPQRFGHGGRNLDQARRLFAEPRRRVKHFQRGMYLSAARSEVFNRILAERVADGSWNRLLSGEVAMLAGSRSFFPITAVTDELQQRLEIHDIHPSGALWGAGELPGSDESAELEQRIAGDLADLCDGLAAAGLRQERRALRLLLEAPSMRLDGDRLTLEFALPAGAYATSVVRELVDTEDDSGF